MLKTVVVLELFEEHEGSFNRLHKIASYDNDDWGLPIPLKGELIRHNGTVYKVLSRFFEVDANTNWRFVTIQLVEWIS